MFSVSNALLSTGAKGRDFGYSFCVKRFSVQVDTFEHLLIFLLKVVFIDIEWLKPLRFSIFIIRAHRAHPGTFLHFFYGFFAILQAFSSSWLRSDCFLFNWERFPEIVLICCRSFCVRVGGTIRPDFLEQILHFRRLIWKTLIINVHWRLPRYYLSHTSVKTIHSRHKFVQCLREFVSIYCVLTESIQNLVFTSVLEFFPVFKSVKIRKKLALRRVAQVR